MKKIIELEIKNMSSKKRQEYYKLISVDEDINYWIKKVGFDEYMGSTFWEIPTQFIIFQKNYKNSLYNQAIKKHGFKDLNYADVLENLTKKQKELIIWEIMSKIEYLTDEEGDDFYEKPYIVEITDEFRKIFEEQVEQELKNLNDKDKEKTKSLIEQLEQYKNNKYVLTTVLNEDEEEDLIFFEDEDELIYFALTKSEIASKLHYKYQEILDPHYKINQWIINNLNA